MNLLEDFLPVILPVIAIGISILAWHKNRAVYEIIIEDDKLGHEKINKLLKTGKYTILHVKQDGLNILRTVYILGKIKN